MNISREIQPPAELLCAWDHIAGHTYLVIYAPGQERQATRVLSRWATNPHLNFRTAHAVRLAEQILALKES